MTDVTPNNEVKKPSNLIWIDLEMTGLDPNKERIIEIATIVTDCDLNIIEEGPVLAINQPTALLDAMDEWCTRTHGASGLTQRVKDSKVTIAEAEAATLAFLRRHIEEGASPMCGNSVHQDRRFMVNEMPELEAFFHYRNLDVSTLKELAVRWHPELPKKFKKAGTHLALDDIRESIAELRFYRDEFIRLPENPSA
ncbi:oligoribonuclease [Marinospirillum minutulum]|uniref:oligoribonuclease n=1 Tax=Marinospirillum minutulum TaxID=64974 RepID=UPI00040E37E7|nr:oligoribonuclease [Marinospirillum minutulum]